MVETARRVLEYAVGTPVMPTRVLVQRYRREIEHGLQQYRIPVRHFLLRADEATLQQRIAEDRVLGPSAFR